MESSDHNEVTLAATVNHNLKSGEIIAEKRKRYELKLQEAKQEEIENNSITYKFFKNPNYYFIIENYIKTFGWITDDQLGKKIKAKLKKKSIDVDMFFKTFKSNDDYKKCMKNKDQHILFHQQVEVIIIEIQTILGKETIQRTYDSYMGSKEEHMNYPEIKFIDMFWRLYLLDMDFWFLQERVDEEVSLFYIKWQHTSNFQMRNYAVYRFRCLRHSTRKLFTQDFIEGVVLFKCQHMTADEYEPYYEKQKNGKKIMKLLTELENLTPNPQDPEKKKEYIAARNYIINFHGSTFSEQKETHDDDDYSEKESEIDPFPTSSNGSSTPPRTQSYTDQRTPVTTQNPVNLNSDIPTPIQNLPNTRAASSSTNTLTYGDMLNDYGTLQSTNQSTDVLTLQSTTLPSTNQSTDALTDYGTLQSTFTDGSETVESGSETVESGKKTRETIEVGENGEEEKEGNKMQEPPQGQLNTDDSENRGETVETRGEENTGDVDNEMQEDPQGQLNTETDDNGESADVDNEMEEPPQVNTDGSETRGETREEDVDNEMEEPPQVNTDGSETRGETVQSGETTEEGKTGDLENEIQKDPLNTNGSETRGETVQSGETRGEEKTGETTEMQEDPQGQLNTDGSETRGEEKTGETTEMQEDPQSRVNTDGSETRGETVQSGETREEEKTGDLENENEMEESPQSQLNTNGSTGESGETGGNGEMEEPPQGQLNTDGSETREKEKTGGVDNENEMEELPQGQLNTDGSETRGETREKEKTGGVDNENEMEEPPQEKTGGVDNENEMEEPPQEKTGGVDNENEMEEPPQEKTGGVDNENEMEEPPQEKTGGVDNENDSPSHIDPFAGQNSNHSEMKEDEDPRHDDDNGDMEEDLQQNSLILQTRDNVNTDMVLENIVHTNDGITLDNDYFEDRYKKKQCIFPDCNLSDRKPLWGKYKEYEKPLHKLYHNNQIKRFVDPAVMIEGYEGNEFPLEEGMRVQAKKHEEDENYEPGIISFVYPEKRFKSENSPYFSDGTCDIIFEPQESTGFFCCTEHMVPLVFLIIFSLNEHEETIESLQQNLRQKLQHMNSVKTSQDLQQELWDKVYKRIAIVMFSQQDELFTVNHFMTKYFFDHLSDSLIYNKKTECKGCKRKFGRREHQDYYYEKELQKNPFIWDLDDLETKHPDILRNDHYCDGEAFDF